MRYSIISKERTAAQLESEAEKAGARNITRSKLLSGVFCDLDEEQVEKLSRIPALKIKPLKEYKTDQVMAEVPPVETVSDVFYLLRSYFTPPLTGQG